MTQPYPSFPQPVPYATGPQNPPGEVPLNKPYYGIGFGGAMKRFFQKYATFSGRASRSEYWWAYLGMMLVFLGLFILTFGLTAATGGFEADQQDPPAVFLLGMGVIVILFLAVIVPSIAVSVRRLHDANLSGWLYLLSLVPWVGGIVIIVLMCQGSKPEGARFDDDFAGFPYPPGGYPPPYGAPGYPQAGYPAQPPAPPADPAQPYGTQPPAEPTQPYGTQPPAYPSYPSEPPAPPQA